MVSPHYVQTYTLLVGMLSYGINSVSNFVTIVQLVHIDLTSQFSFLRKSKCAKNSMKTSEVSLDLMLFP